MQAAALLVALASKGESVDEIVGAARAMRERSLHVEHDLPMVVDVVGTGGDHANTINISTMAALVVASAGIPVAKHGNRAASSACGSADVLEAAGFPLEIAPERAARMLRECGFTFMFAPRYHPAMRNAAGIRRELGVRTIFNLLGPADQSGARDAPGRRRRAGVARRTHRRDACAALGAQRGAVVHGCSGVDEVVGDAPTLVYSFDEEGARAVVASSRPSSASTAPLRTPIGGSVEACRDAFVEILGGARSPAADVVALNAAVVFCVIGRRRAASRRRSSAREACCASGDAWRTFERAKEMARMADAGSSSAAARAWATSQLAIEAGADAFGMIFAPSPRRISIGSCRRDRAARCRPRSHPVAVFVESAHEARSKRCTRSFRARSLQFSGDESPEFVARYGERAIKAIHVDAPRRALIAKRRGTLSGRDCCCSIRATTAWPAAPARRLHGSRPLPIASAAARRHRRRPHARERRRSVWRRAHPFGVDVRSGIETGGRKDPSEDARVRARGARAMKKPDARGYFGDFGGRFVPEVLIAALDELERAIDGGLRRSGLLERVPRGAARLRRPSLADLSLRALRRRRFGGAARDEARRHQSHRRAQDQQHRRSGAARAAHGQTPSACRNRRGSARRRDRDGRREVRPAGRRLHGRARRRAPGAQRARDATARRARCTRSSSGTQTLKDATNEAFRVWAERVDDTFYVIGSVVGAHPYPYLVREFQKVIGVEARRQVLGALRTSCRATSSPASAAAATRSESSPVSSTIPT